MSNVVFLIERWLNGDERAAEMLYSQHRDQIFRLAYGLLGNAADAEEAAQDALKYALVNISRFDATKSQFSTWLHTITVSRCRDRLRRKQLPRLPWRDWLHRGQDMRDSEPTPERTAVATETHTEIWQAVQSLSQPLREVVILRFWAGHTYREIAEMLNCPVATVQSRIRLAYPHLRAALAQDDLLSLSQERVP